MAFTDNAESIGEMCCPCLDYVNRRKHDGGDPTGGPAPWGNWPAREWPTLADLEEARRRYPEAMFADDAAHDAAAPDWDAQTEVVEASMVWRMEREARG